MLKAKKILAVTLCASFFASFAFSTAQASRTANPTTSIAPSTTPDPLLAQEEPAVQDIALVEPETESPQSASLNKFIEKYGWDSKNLFWYANDIQTGFQPWKNSPSNDETLIQKEFDALIKVSKEAKLPGFSSDQQGIVYHSTLLMSDKYDDIYYTISAHIYTDSKNNHKIVAAELSFTTMTGNSGEHLAMSKPAPIKNKLKTTIQQNTAKPIDSIAALDFLGGWKATSSQQKSLSSVFAKSPWKNTKFTFYFTIPSDSDKPVLGKAEHRKALLATEKGGIKLDAYQKSLSEGILPNNANGLSPSQAPTETSTYSSSASKPAALLLEQHEGLNNRFYVAGPSAYDPDSNYYLYQLNYSEQRYSLNSKQYYYIDFAADLIFDDLILDDVPVSNEGETTPRTSLKRTYYAFLMVKPGKKNKQGSLDRFFYPITSNQKTIEADMKLYFSGKTPKNDVKLPD